MSDDIPMTDFSALEREGRSDVERSALRRAGEFCRVIIDMQAAELTALRQRLALLTLAAAEATPWRDRGGIMRIVNRCDSHACGQRACLFSDGVVTDTCGEPCSWVMKKSGHGHPPFLSDDQVIEEIRLVLMRQSRHYP